MELSKADQELMDALTGYDLSFAEGMVAIQMVNALEQPLETDERSEHINAVIADLERLRDREDDTGESDEEEEEEETPARNAHPGRGKAKKQCVDCGKLKGAQAFKGGGDLCTVCRNRG